MLGETIVLLSLTIGPAVLVLLAAVSWVVCRKKFRCKERIGGAVWLPVFLLFVLLGMARAGYVRRDWETRERCIREIAGVCVELEGRLKAVEESGGSVQLTLEENKVRPAGKDQNGSGHGMDRRIPCVLVSWKPAEGGGGACAAQRLKIGMKIKVRGELEPFDCARNPGEFDYRSYYRAQGMDCRMFGEQVETVDDTFFPLQEFLRRIREKAAANMKKSASPEDAGIFSASVLGDKKELNSAIKELYQKNGLAHLLAISGLHLSIIGMSVYKLLRKAGLGFCPAGLAGAAFIVCYGVMTGGSPSVVRAVSMMAAGFLASCLGRTYDLICAASLALFLLAWRSPELLTQGGVQLSFGAVFAVGGVRPVIQTYLGKTGKLFGALTVSAAIQMVTLPVILWDFYQFPVYGVFLNLLVIPLMGGVICSGTGAALLGGFSGRAGMAAAGCGHYILQFYEWLCHGIDSLPFHILVMGRPKAAAVILYYAVLAAALAGMKKASEKKTAKGKAGGKKAAEEEPVKKIRKVCLRPVVFLCICALTPCFLAPHPVDGLEVIFLDVGQGDGILLRCGHSAVLIDGGSTSEKKLGQYRLEPCLKSCGVSVIEYAFVSHGDLDHLSGVKYLLESCDEIVIRNLFLSCQGREDEALTNLADLAGKRGTRVAYIQAGDRFRAEKIGITCLYPGPEDAPADTNEESEVLKVDYGNCHMLFTGDMSGDGELRLLSQLSQYPGVLSDISVLKTAHHGSRFSSGDEFLDALGVKWSVISYGEGNSYGHPHKEVLERLRKRGVKIYKTAKSGAVTMRTDGKKVKWRTFLN